MIIYEKLVEANTIYDIYKLFYYECSKNKFAWHWPKSPESFFHERKIILFGAGNFGEKVVKNLNNKGLVVDYICDNDSKKWGRFIGNLEVHPPQKLNSEDKSSTIVIISSMYQEQIADQLDSIGADYVYSTTDGEYSYLPKAPEKTWDMLDLYWNHREDIDKVYSILSDEFSRKVYMDVIKAKIIESNMSYRAYYWSLLGSIYEGKQYFDRRYFKYDENEVFVDCGAFMGDTILEFFNSNISGCKNKVSPIIYAFEPDIINYNTLNELLKSNGYDSYVKTILSGVGNSKSTLCPDDIINCRYDGIANDVDVPVVSLDNALSEIPVTFMKMDIEGYELEALQGAEVLIKKYKPKLAISIYHKPEHFFQIPLLLKEFVPEYKIYIKQHVPYKASETICYACV